MTNGFVYFLTFNLLFFLAQIIFITLKGHTFVHSIPLPKSVYWELGYTIYLQGFGYLLISIWQSILLFFQNASFNLSHFERSNHSIAKFKIIRGTLLITTWIAILSLNAYFFPLSQYSRVFFTTHPRWLILVYIAVTVILLTLISWPSLKKLFRFYPLYIVSAALLLLNDYHPFKPHNTHNTKPNIVIIGIDSLNPRYINQHTTPTLQQFIHHSVWFQETISPLARTYPAWSTILTGLHPHHHQAHYNLIAEDKAGQASIAWKLKQAGYTTFYATDDRRFNLLDKSFGFEQVVGPKRGINDFLLGTFNDFPLGNLTINSLFGQWFFPYNYINRASYFSYYPETFDQHIQKQLVEKSQNPLFMAVHFTLPHWPYAYARSTDPSAFDEYNITARIPLYQEALQAVDQQVAHLLSILEQNNFLHNTLVFVLSDHGETFYTPSSRPTENQNYQGHHQSTFETYLSQYTSTTLDKSAGHGSDLLSREQYHCLLAIQYYQNNIAQYPAKIITERIGLQDIAPTILEFTKQPTPNLDGYSLLSKIKENAQLPHRAFMLESEMLPNQFLTREKARLIGKEFFAVNFKNSLLQIKPQKLAALDSEKLYAILEDDWILALYPVQGAYLPVLQKISTNAWTDHLNSSFAKHSPAQSLLKQMEQFYHRSWVILPLRQP